MTWVSFILLTVQVVSSIAQEKLVPSSDQLKYFDFGFFPAQLKLVRRASCMTKLYSDQALRSLLFTQSSCENAQFVVRNSVLVLAVSCSRSLSLATNLLV